MCFDYDESASVYESTQVKTRKQHRCEACKRIIQKGERAECCSGLFDYAWFRYYVCDGCQRVIMAIALKELQEGCPWHTAWIAPQDLQEYQSEMRSYGEEIKPLGMPTLEDCRRVVNDCFERRDKKWWQQGLIELEA